MVRHRGRRRALSPLPLLLALLALLTARALAAPIERVPLADAFPSEALAAQYAVVPGEDVQLDALDTAGGESHPWSGDTRPAALPPPRAQAAQLPRDAAARAPPAPASLVAALSPLFGSPRGTRGPCPPNGVYSGPGASGVGFCCDGDLCGSCGGAECAGALLKVQLGRGRGAPRPCCQGWLERHGSTRMRLCDPSGALPCYFNASRPRAVTGEQVQLEPHALFKASNAGAAPHYESCAVVASSPTLAGEGMGARIDAHEAVVRFNMAPTRGYEVDVGARTAVMVMNDVVSKMPDKWVPHCAGFDMALFVFHFMKNERRRIEAGVRRAAAAAPSKGGRRCNATIASDWDDSFKRPYHDICRKWAREHDTKEVTCKRPSSGAIGILYATLGGLCRHTTLFGWAASAKKPREGHYWNFKHRSSPLAHSYALEHVLALYIAHGFNASNMPERTVTVAPV